jgi:hypothetical protein
MLVRFPVRRRVIERIGLNYNDRRAAIDGKLREIDNAISALRARRRSLLSEYRHELLRDIAPHTIVG